MELYDLHCHTFLSACAARDAEIDDYVKDADEGGLRALGFADHAWDEGLGTPSGFYAPQNYKRLLTRKCSVKHRVRVFYGAEGEYARGLLAVRAETMKLFDYIIIPHSHTHMKGFVLPAECEAPGDHGRFLLESFVSLLNHPHIGGVFGIAHPFHPCGKKFEEAEEILSYITNEEFENCGALAAQKGVFLELNMSAAFAVPEEKAEDCSYARFFRNAKKGGAKFFLGTDNHRPKPYQDNLIFRAPERAKPFGLTEGDFTDALSRILRG